MTTAAKPRRSAFRKAALRGPEERNALVEANMGLIGFVLNKQHPRLIALLGGREECEQELAIALMRAADLYDPSGGGKFCTYAVHCLTLVFRTLLERKSGIIRLPARSRREIPLLICHSLDERIQVAAPVEPDSTELGEVCERLHHALARLTKRHAEAIRLRWLEERSLPEIGQQWGVSKERARQVCDDALEKLCEEMQEGESCPTS